MSRAWGRHAWPNSHIYPTRRVRCAPEPSPPPTLTGMGLLAFGPVQCAGSCCKCITLLAQHPEPDNAQVPVHPSSQGTGTVRWFLACYARQVVDCVS